jgi:Type II secretion system (T2SS), protein G
VKRKTLVFALLFGMAASAAKAGSPRDFRRQQADQWYRCIRTLMDMRAIQTAIEAYGVDHPAYPKAKTIEELRELVQPSYIANTPMKDAWGTPFRYLVSPDGKTYRLVSAGSDGTFAEASWAVPAFLSDSEADAVLTSEGWATYREWVIQE